MQKITPFLWFNGQAEEAINFYVGIFKNARVVNLSRQPGESPDKPGQIFMGIFEIEGQQFYALNGGPAFTFSPAISFYVNCTSQDEVDSLWDKLSDGGEKQQCGWLKDKYGISWQIIPDSLPKLMGGGDPARSQRVMQAMLK